MTKIVRCIQQILELSGIAAIITCIWQLIEIMFMGEVKPSNVDTLIGLILSISMYCNWITTKVIYLDD